MARVVAGTRLQLDVHNGLATMTFDTFADPSKKANVIDSVTIAELETCVEHLKQYRSGELRGVIVTSGKRGMFIAGADIREMQSFKDAEAIEQFVARVHKLFGDLEALPVPVVAAINGACLGGGFELALACHYRIAADDPTVRIGLPETRLGLIPGFGGTQRLPRLVGITEAIRAITTGRRYSAREAAHVHLVDEVVSPARLLREAAEVMVHGDMRRTNELRARKTLLELLPGGPRLIAAVATKRSLKNTHGHYPAIPQAIAAVAHSVKPFEKGIAFERQAVTNLALHPVSRRLLWLYAAKELGEAAKHQLAHLHVQPKDTRSVAVVGAGVMGTDIAYALLSAGIPVVLNDIFPEALRKAEDSIRSYLASQVRRGKMTQDDADEAVARFCPTLALTDLTNADLVIETIAKGGKDDREAKAETIARIRTANPRAVIASNTSSLRIADLGEGVVGMHFFNPAYTMPLVEIVRTETTSDEDLATVVALAVRMKKTPVIAADSPGFFINRLLVPYFLEALALLNSGVSIEDIDRAMREFGMPMGPYRLLDEVGIDIAQSVFENLSASFPDRMTAQLDLSPLVNAGFRGKKSGKGFWFPGGKKPNREALEFLAIAQPYGSRRPEPSFIADRLFYAMANEGVRALEEGVIADTDLADLAAVLGIGFPPFRGGVFAELDSRGTKRALEAMLAMRDLVPVPERYQPCVLFRKKGRANERFRTDLL